jgi:hypothetical protein
MKTLRLLAVIATAVIIAGSCTAQDGPVLPPDRAAPKIEGKTEYQAGQLVRLALSGLPADVGYEWEVEPPTIDRATTDESLLQFAAVPGTYRVRVVLFWIDSATKRPRVKTLTTAVRIGDVKPPEPGPIDDLAREVKRLYDASPEAGATKVAIGRHLAALYRYGVADLAKKDANGKPYHPTSGSLDAAMAKYIRDNNVPAGLDGVRQLTRARCQSILGGSDPTTFLDDAKRSALSDVLGKLALAVEAATR